MFQEKVGFLTLKMKTIILFLIYLVLADGAAISNVEVESDVTDMVQVVQAELSKVKGEKTYVTSSKYCTGIVLFGFFLSFSTLIYLIMDTIWVIIERLFLHCLMLIIYLLLHLISLLKNARNK